MAAAHANGMENLPFFTSAIITSYLLKVESKIVDNVAFGYLVSRVLYSYLYVTGKTFILIVIIIVHSLSSIVFRSLFAVANAKYRRH